MNTPTNATNEREMYLQLINAKSTIEPILKHLRMKKRWQIAVSKDNALSQKQRNASVELRYKIMLAEFKKLFADTKHPVFERDYRYDNTQSALTMHAYFTHSFYFTLECDLAYKYQIDFACNRCSFELDIRGMVIRLLRELNPREVMLKPKFTEFYLNTLKAQDSKYIAY
jgi:hypothetical protein